MGQTKKSLKHWHTEIAATNVCAGFLIGYKYSLRLPRCEMYGHCAIMSNVTEHRNSKFHVVGTCINAAIIGAFNANVRLIGDVTSTATTIKHSKRSCNIYLGYCMLKFYTHNSSIYVNQPTHRLPVIIVLFVICDHG